MRITKLSLTNFRSFKETQTIEFAPVTLLFGPNSVGKSTVLTALFYLQQILGKEQCNPMRIDALGNKHIGGFKNLVNGKDLGKSISLAVEYDKGDSIGQSYYHLADLLPDSLPFYLESPIVEAKKVEVKFELKWSNTLDDAYIANYIVRLDGIGIAQIMSDAGRKQPQIVGINYLHPLLRTNNHDEFLHNSIDDQNIHPELVVDAFAEKNINLPSHRDIKNGADDIINDYVNNGLNISDDCYVGDLHELLVKSHDKVKINGVDLLHSPLGINSNIGATPLLGQLLETSIDLDDEIQNTIVREILSDLLVAPLDNLLSILNESLCIGPLRHIPDSEYVYSSYKNNADWYDGKACWDELNRNKALSLKLNDWLEREDKFNLGYKFVFKIKDAVNQYIETNSTTDSFSLDLLQDFLSSNEDGSISQDNDRLALKNIKGDSDCYLSIDAKKINIPSKLYLGGKNTKETELVLWDIKNNIEVSPADIGTGISQLMPLVIAALTSRKGIIACEQPELHVHPRVQVAIGDLLTQSNSKVNFLIETHSEHLILRLLRRVRETTNGELPAGNRGVKPSDISIVFLSSSDDGVQASHLKITDDGDFSEDWPGGFFDERDEELF